jgi:hypothetical protein
VGPRAAPRGKGGASYTYVFERNCCKITSQIQATERRKIIKDKRKGSELNGAIKPNIPVYVL